MLVLSLVSTITFARGAKVDGSVVSYKGKKYSVEGIYEQAKVEKELANAQAVYAFRLSDVSADTGNASDWCETYINQNDGRYAVNFYLNDRDMNYVVNRYVVFNGKKAKVYKKLPRGFSLTFDNPEFGYSYADADMEGNSLIVYVK